MSRRSHILQMIDDAAKVGIPIRKAVRSIKIAHKLLETFVQSRFNNPHQTSGCLIVSIIEVPTKESAPKTTVRLLYVGLRHVTCLQRREAHIVVIDTVVIVPNRDKSQLLVNRSFIRVRTHLPNNKDGQAQQNMDGVSQMVLSEQTEHRRTIALLCTPAQASLTQ